MAPDPTLPSEINYFSPNPPEPRDPVNRLATVITMEFTIGVLTKTSLSRIERLIADHIDNFLAQRDAQH